MIIVMRKNEHGVSIWSEHLDMDRPSFAYLQPFGSEKHAVVLTALIEGTTHRCEIALDALGLIDLENLLFEARSLMRRRNP